jgi:hypothetical protein
MGGAGSAGVHCAAASADPCRDDEVASGRREEPGLPRGDHAYPAAPQRPCRDAGSEMASAAEVVTHPLKVEARAKEP